MNKSPAALPEAYQRPRDLSRRIGQILVVGLLVCLGTAFTLFGERLFPAWRATILIPLSLLCSVEAFITRRRVEDLDFQQRLGFHASEWVAFAILIKLSVSLMHGPAQLMAELPLWEQNFIENFFTGDYIFALIIIALVWINAYNFTGELDELFQREHDATWDELGKLQNALHEIRGRIAGRIFTLGALVTVLAVFTRLPIQAVLLPRDSNRLPPAIPILVVLIYFCLGLALLSQTQFTLLRTRWIYQRLPVDSRITGYWIRYTLLFFLALAVIVFFLPTQYSIGLLDTLRYVIEFTVQLFSFLILLITLPFTFCLSLFNLASSQPQQPLVPPAPIPPPAVQTGTPPNWLEIVRSLVFWGFFLGVIFIAMRYYLSQNADVWNRITRFPMIRWVSAIWRWIAGWFKGANRQIFDRVKVEVERLRRRRKTTTAHPSKGLFSPARQTPRDRVIDLYLKLVQTAGDQGLERRPAQTPNQYLDRLTSALPDVEEDLNGITGAFLEARYSRHPVEPAQSDRAAHWWNRIKTVLATFRPGE